VSGNDATLITTINVSEETEYGLHNFVISYREAGGIANGFFNYKSALT